MLFFLQLQDFVQLALSLCMWPVSSKLKERNISATETWNAYQIEFGLLDWLAIITTYAVLKTIT